MDQEVKPPYHTTNVSSKVLKKKPRRWSKRRNKKGALDVFAVTQKHYNIPLITYPSLSFSVTMNSFTLWYWTNYISCIMTMPPISPFPSLFISKNFLFVLHHSLSLPIWNISWIGSWHRLINFASNSWTYFFPRLITEIVPCKG